MLKCVAEPQKKTHFKELSLRMYVRLLTIVSKYKYHHDIHISKYKGEWDYFLLNN